MFCALSQHGITLSAPACLLTVRGRASEFARENPHVAPGMSMASIGPCLFHANANATLETPHSIS
jgi:hypothetical protein